MSKKSRTRKTNFSKTRVHFFSKMNFPFSKTCFACNGDREKRARNVLSQRARCARERKIPIQSSSFGDGPSYIYARGRARWFLIQKIFFFGSPLTWERSETRERVKSGREIEERVRARLLRRRQRGEEKLRGSVACFDGVSDAALQATWPVNHLNALRFRCWACDMRWNLHVVKCVVVTQWNVANNVAHIQVYKRERRREKNESCWQTKEAFLSQKSPFRKQIQQIQNFMVR